MSSFFQNFFKFSVGNLTKNIKYNCEQNLSVKQAKDMKKNSHNKLEKKMSDKKINIRMNCLLF